MKQRKQKKRQRFLALVMAVMFVVSNVTSGLAASGIMDITKISRYAVREDVSKPKPESTIWFGKNSKATGAAANAPIQWRVLAVNSSADSYGITSAVKY